MEEHQMRDSLKKVEDEVIYLQETLREAKAEFQRIVHENDELRVKQDDSLKKIKELYKLLEEAFAKKYTEETSELSESEKDYDLLPKVVEFSEENGHRNAEEKSSSIVKTLDGMNMKLEEDAEKKEKKEDSPDDATVEVEFKTWESCQIEKKEGFFHKGKPEQESAKDEEEDSNMIDQSEKTSDELLKEKEKKKKKTLFGKVGNILKKKRPMNQK